MYDECRKDAKEGFYRLQKKYFLALEIHGGRSESRLAGGVSSEFAGSSAPVSFPFLPRSIQTFRSRVDLTLIAGAKKKIWVVCMQSNVFISQQ